MQPGDFPGIEGNLQAIPQEREAMKAARILVRLEKLLDLHLGCTCIISYSHIPAGSPGALDLTNVACFLHDMHDLSWIS